MFSSFQVFMFSKFSGSQRLSDFQTFFLNILHTRPTVIRVHRAGSQQKKINYKLFSDCEQTHKGELGAGHRVRGDGSCNGCYTRGPDDCKKRCDANPDCAAWNLQTRTNRCWFKKKGFTTGDGHGYDEWVWGHSCKFGKVISLIPKNTE